jgi:hypothetical protein
MSDNCCKQDKNLSRALELFSFANLRKAVPPPEKGIYVIRIKKRGESFINSLEELSPILKKVDWEIVSKYVKSRVTRVSRLEKCDIIYIGRAGSIKENSKNTLKGRYGELANRHTIQFPLWLMLYLGWDLEYGWKVCKNPEQEEDDLKLLYKKFHSGKLPALVEK